MEANDTITALRGLQVQTGSLACLGCGHEHNCGTRGCAIIRKAADQLERMNNFSSSQAAKLLAKAQYLNLVISAIDTAAIGYLESGPYDDNGQTASKFAHAVLELTGSVMREEQRGNANEQ